MIHHIELSEADSELVARGIPINVELLANTYRRTQPVVRIILTKKSWHQIRTTYNSRLIRVTLGGS